jgi:hypothetical protein
MEVAYHLLSAENTAVVSNTPITTPIRIKAKVSTILILHFLSVDVIHNTVLHVTPAPLNKGIFNDPRCVLAIRLRFVEHHKNIDADNVTTPIPAVMKFANPLIQKA